MSFATQAALASPLDRLEFERETLIGEYSAAVTAADDAAVARVLERAAAGAAEWHDAQIRYLEECVADLDAEYEQGRADRRADLARAEAEQAEARERRRALVRSGRPQPGLPRQATPDSTERSKLVDLRAESMRLGNELVALRAAGPRPWIVPGADVVAPPIDMVVR